LSYLQSEEGADTLARVLQYHAIAASVPAGILVTGPVTTLSQDDIDIVVSDTGIVINGESAVVTQDILASNGIAHTIDTVLIPPTSTESPTSAGTLAHCALPVSAAFALIIKVLLT
jgi:transforming growth factor-beta-induced protein